MVNTNLTDRNSPLNNVNMTVFQRLEIKVPVPYIFRLTGSGSGAFRVPVPVPDSKTRRTRNVRDGFPSVYKRNQL